MRKLAVFCVVAALVAMAHAEDAQDAVKAVVLTGGHSFDAKAFEALFDDMAGIEVTFADQKDDSEIFEDVAEWPYDVIVLYNMGQKITPKRQENFLGLLNKGVGLVMMHHAMTAFEGWPEYAKVIGGVYRRQAEVVDGKELPACAYQHDIDFDVHVEDPDHPVTQGIQDFTVHDETYIRCRHEPDSHVLLTTNHPTSDRVVGWSRTYGQARVCGVQMGHGPQIFAQPEYKRFVAQAIRFCAASDKE
ncbi:MAG TPA: ThuA domain-containing protein [Candidatus Hydrogenedentes bacterium]|nr:ThuA domain-containing protein [Candidatus Hydrogenedentota bacterium]HPG66905.1 ThuA domain-containing protein [Candidatus Hydrogenedentota bacterium]